MLAFVLVVPLIPYGLAETGVQFTNPGADLWREVRQRVQAPMTHPSREASTARC